MEAVLSLAIGVLAASGVWLVLRPRTFQVIVGLNLLSYAVNLFIFSMGRLVAGAPAIMPRGGFVNPDRFADPVPQALVLTAIVISFATTALFLVVMIASRGLSGTDHVDGRERTQAPPAGASPGTVAGAVPVTAAEHLLVAPILIPFFTGAVLIFFDGRRPGTKRALSLASALSLLVVAALLMGRVSSAEAPGTYLLGNWPVPFGIALTLDRLAATMLLLVALLAVPALLHATAGWDRRGQHFHALFQFLLMGLNGAFLTGDLFNLFVFFEVLLAASYGLLLHGSGPERVRAGLHYIAVNLLASLMFLIGVSLVYGVTGTLNMAHLATLVPMLPPEDRPLLHLGAAFLGLAFLAKAGIWPLSFWLPGAYAAAAPPVAAMFAIMTKVGVYALLRLSTLLFGEGAGPSAGFGAEVLSFGGMLTVAFGLVGVLASATLGHMAAHLVLISAGTVLAAAGFAQAGGGGGGLLAGGLYYLLGSTLASSALFLLIGPLGRGEGVDAPPLPPADPDGADAVEEEDDDEVGIPIPGAVALLGLCFAGCALALAGMPPLAGFVGKVAILSSLLEGGAPAGPQPAAWVFLALLLVSGLATVIGLARVGIRVFWAGDDETLRAWPLEVGPVVGLLAAVCAMTIWGQAVMDHLDATAVELRPPPATMEATP